MNPIEVFSSGHPHPPGGMVLPPFTQGSARAVGDGGGLEILCTNGCKLPARRVLSCGHGYCAPCLLEPDMSYAGEGFCHACRTGVVLELRRGA